MQLVVYTGRNYISHRFTIPVQYGVNIISSAIIVPAMLDMRSSSRLLKQSLVY